MTSDTHLGGLMSRAGRDLARFLEFAAAGGYTVCINGDGLELMHSSLASMTRESFEFFRHVKRTFATSLRIHYVVGNHDIVLERFVNQWGFVNLVPFLNVRSGGRRIHIQHGHLYDPAFMRSPRFYNWATRASGTVLRLDPRFFRAYEIWLRLIGRRAPAATRTLAESGEDKPFVEAARAIARRGFDAVIFGHTHVPGVLELAPDAMYYNTGSWFGDPRYVRIERGELALERWPTRPATGRSQEART